MTTRKLLENGAVCAAALIFSGLLVKEWFAVKAADAITAKTGQPQNAPASGPFAGLSEVFNFHPMYAQEQFFARWATPGLYVPEPEIIDKLDLDDLVIQGNYRRDADTFTKRLKELNIDINKVWVRPDPVNIRLLALQEGNPATAWTLYLLTGDDTAQQLQDGIHLRRRGFADKLVGWPVQEKDVRNHSEASRVLWRPSGRGGWKIDSGGSDFVRWISTTSTIHEIKKHKDLGPQYQLSCDALRQFVQPLKPGKTTREITLKIDVPVSPKFDRSSNASPCVIWLR